MKLAASAARQVQMVFQDPYGSLHPCHTIGDILEEPLQIHRINDRDRGSMCCWIKLASTAPFASAYPHQLRRAAAAWR